MLKINKITFDEILPLWENKLWPNRKSQIKPMSSMTYDKLYDMEIYNNYVPTFWGVFDNNKLIGVNSGHKTNSHSYRSRGIWVDPNYRGKNIAYLLFLDLEEQALLEGCNNIWSIPRRGSESAYLKFGFKLVGDWFDNNMEFGPNIYAIKHI